MRFSKTVVACVAIFGSVAANAGLVASQGGNANPAQHMILADPSPPGGAPPHLNGCAAPTPCTATPVGPGTGATIVGGSIYTGDLPPSADVPVGVTGGTYLSAGPSHGNTSTMTFNAPITYVSFLWGSPDTYNQLTVNYSGGSQVFTVANFALPGNGDQTFSAYVQFQATAGDTITSLVFSNVPGVNAFEVGNFSTVVPEPGTLALFGAGLVGMWLAVRRRKGSVVTGLSAA